MHLHIPALTSIIYLAAGSVALPMNQTKTPLNTRDQYAPMGINMWATTNCEGGFTTINPITSQTNVYQNGGKQISFASYHLSRNLQPGEQLDFSYPGQGANADNPCGQYMTSTYEGQVDTTKCQTLQGNAAGCIRLWHS